MLAEKLRSLKKRMLRIGSAARRSITTNAISEAAAIPSRASITGDVQPHCVPPWFKAISSGTRPVTSASVPHQSSACF